MPVFVLDKSYLLKDVQVSELYPHEEMAKGNIEQIPSTGSLRIKCLVRMCTDNFSFFWKKKKYWIMADAT